MIICRWNDIQIELWNLTGGMVLDFNHPLKETMAIHQQNAKQVIATATFKNIITSS